MLILQGEISSLSPDELCPALLPWAVGSAEKGRTWWLVPLMTGSFSG